MVVQWFDHSSSAASDDAIMALRMEHPDSAAVDCYWGIVEKQFHDERSVPFSETDRETKALAHRLFVGFDVLEKYVETMLDIGLLKKDACGNLYSERAKTAIDSYKRKCETARRNGKNGGRKPKQKPTPKPTEKPTQKPSGPNTKQNNTEIGLDKTKPISGIASVGAAVDESTPPAAPECPTCGADLRRTSSHKQDGSALWLCGLCGTEVWL